MKSDLSHVQNKSAFLCGVMKTYRAKIKIKTEETAAVNQAAGTTNTTGVGGGDNKQGPNEEKVKQLLNRTGYTLDITTGQRKYGGPPPGWEGPIPGCGEKVSFHFKMKCNFIQSSFSKAIFVILECYIPSPKTPLK